MRKFFYRLVYWGGGFGMLALVSWTMLLDGIVANQTYSQHPKQITRLVGGTPKDTAIVLLAATKSSSQQLAAPVRDLLIPHGDVVVVEYNPVRFDGPATSYDTYQELHKWGYRKVVLVGDGLGNAVATDIISWDQALGGHTQFAVIMQNAPLLLQRWSPTTTYDLSATDFDEAISLVEHPGPVDNWGWRVIWDKQYPRSGYITQTRYLVDHPSYQRNQYSGIQLVVLQPQSDLADSWEAVFGGGKVIQVSPDIGSTSQNQWRAALNQGLSALPQGW
jgi:hypothetical protein